jgi:peptidoglycan lytic transglycosylase
MMMETIIFGLRQVKVRLCIDRLVLRGANMASRTFDRPSCAGIAASRIFPREPKRSCRTTFQVSIGALMAAMLAACAQSTVVANKPSSPAAFRQPSPTHVAAVTQKQSGSTHSRQKARTQDASGGLASYYKHGARTASGEKFNAGELTAAHRTLPFGTRVRVTNVATGRSVTVRVNDRGPFVGGRSIDVSYAAAESLGMVGQGVAKVKLDVVR